MTVEEILAAEMYTDRRGRTWHYLDTIVDYDRWQRWEHYSAEDLILEVSEMRLLIERDMHREFCPGLYDCFDHPVPFIVITGGIPWICTGEGERIDYMHSLEGSMSIARALVVGE